MKQTNTKRQELMKPLSNTIFLGIYARCEKEPKLEKSLRGLINGILAERKFGKPLFIKKINKVKVEDTNFGDTTTARGIRIDLLVTAADESIYSLEIQLARDYNMMSRNWYYISRLISKQLKKGDEFRQLSQIAMINILDFDMFDKKRYPEFFKTATLMLEGYEETIVSEEIVFYFIELPKFKLTKKNYNNSLHAWLTYLTEGYGDETMKAELIKKNSDIKAFNEAYMSMHDDDDVWMQYEFERRRIEAYQSGMQSAKEEGKREGQIEKAIESAKAALELGLTPEQVSKITGLSIKEIERYTMY